MILALKEIQKHSTNLISRDCVVLHNVPLVRFPPFLRRAKLLPDYLNITELVPYCQHAPSVGKPLQAVTVSGGGARKRKREQPL